ncbi:DUF6157 family protein [Niabella yanshanensis]|uniref:DUF6157 family protein n=1 Tax=Niabella yanshanensis TaxID=577386 RepID=A0ABZ0W6A6_9BACT|nr:DUF6157 family protein [Niabella yanshanensis]WQD38469.1 DUF6157 family protein [Niabella yanshanensis]
MKQHTTNYSNTLIEIAEDSPVEIAEIPASKGDTKTVARLQYELLAKHPYQYTSDDVLFEVYAQRNDITQAEYKAARDVFFSKGQPCMRASPLTKRYGFGVHADQNGKIALFGAETGDYRRLLKDDNIKKVKAMRTSKK